MNKKKLVAILLGVIWLILLIDRFLLSDQKNRSIELTSSQRETSIKKDKELHTLKNLQYPELKLAIIRKDLFDSPFQSMADNKEEKETKKVITLPAPPLPILPEPKKPEIQKQSEDINDPSKELVLLGVLEKRGKTLAFIKYQKEIKPFNIGQEVFDTNFFVEKIGVKVVILRNKANEELKLELEKEENDGKK